MSGLLEKVDQLKVSKAISEKLSKVNLSDTEELENGLLKIVHGEMMVFFRQESVNPVELDEPTFMKIKELFLAIAQLSYYDLMRGCTGEGCTGEGCTGDGALERVDGMENVEENKSDKSEDVVQGVVELTQEEVDSISRQVKEQFHKAFWDLLASDLKEDPPKTDHIVILLSEIKERINNLTPNNKKLHQEMEEAIDIEYFKQLFRHKVFSLDFLLGTVNFIILERIKKLVAAVNESEVDDWYGELKDRLKTNPPYDEIVPDIFKGVYKWIEKIEDDLKVFYQQINK